LNPCKPSLEIQPHQAYRDRHVGGNTTGKDAILPNGRGSNLKDPELYETLRADGASKEKAARISNAAAKKGRSTIARRGGESGAYDDWTVSDLRTRAKELGLTGYSDKTKADLMTMLRNH
jgi:hypothetical protein